MYEFRTSVYMWKFPEYAVLRSLLARVRDLWRSSSSISPLLCASASSSRSRSLMTPLSEMVTSRSKKQRERKKRKILTIGNVILGIYLTLMILMTSAMKTSVKMMMTKMKIVMKKMKVKTLILMLMENLI